MSGNEWIECYAPLIGRIFVGGFFLWNGIQTALNLPAAAALFASHGLPAGASLAALSVAVEALFGIAIIVGFWTRSAALFLALYLLVRASMLTNFSSDSDLTLFVLNLGLVGGLLYISAFGATNWAVRPHR
jgi:putative oxidoreductase